MKKFVFFPIVAILITGICSTSFAETKYLTLKESMLSFEGDDSFITSRKEYISDSGAWEFIQTYSTKHGFIRFARVNPGYCLTSQNENKSMWKAEINKNSWHQRKGLSANNATIKIKSNNMGEYYEISYGNESYSCIKNIQVYGAAPADCDNFAVGDSKIVLAQCWPRHLATDNNLITFVDDLMARMRDDDGELNERKAMNKDKPKYNEKNEHPPTNTPSAASKPPATDTSSTPEAAKKVPRKIETRLLKLKELEKEGLITQGEAAFHRMVIGSSLSVNKPLSSKDIESRLLKLKKLEEKGLISKEDAAEKRKKLLEEL